MQLTSKWLPLAALTAVSLIAPADADVLKYQLRGTVTSIVDPTGALGSPAPGAAFELTYLADYSLGAENGGGGGGGGNHYLSGGTLVPPDPNYPTIHISPVSATLKVNGHQLDFAAEYFGSVQYTYNLLGEIFGGGPSYSWMNLTAQTAVPNSNPAVLMNEISAQVDSPLSASLLGLKLPGVWQVNGTSVTASASFNYLWAAGTPEQSFISGSLAPSVYSVAVVPEPAAWSLLALGGLGLLLLHRRRSSSLSG